MRKVKGVLYSKYMPVFTKKKYYNDITDNLICSKSCHLVSCLKESMIYDFIDEFRNLTCSKDATGGFGYLAEGCVHAIALRFGLLTDACEDVA